ncbi:MAG: hypothetical protein M0P33_09280 [Massilibacteroides sp.]|nr:hypothetical protein [Massilibacteroides sp.]
MEKIINLTAIIFFFINSWSNVLFAQNNADSLRIVNEALKMIQFPEPVFNEPFITNPSPKEISDLGLEQVYNSEEVQFKMRDGISIHRNKFDHSSGITVLFLHGALGSSYTNNKTDAN